MAGGSLIGVSHEAELKKLTALARKRYPEDVPLVAPIPRKEDLLLSAFCNFPFRSSQD